MQTRSLVIGLLVSVSGCATHRPPPPAPAPPSLVEASPVEAPPPPQLEQPKPEVTLLDDLPPDVAQAMEHYLSQPNTKKAKKPPIIEARKDGFIRYPYGYSQPVVYCAPFELCDIELQEGEVVNDVGAGDTVRWSYFPVREGEGAKQKTLVVVKPNDEFVPLRSTMVIGTNRRTYRIKLVSKPGRRGVVNVKFYYPQDIIEQWNQRQQAHHAAQHDVATTLPAVSVEDLDDRYRIEGDAPFRPTWVANDGTRTFLRMPASVGEAKAPALFVEAENGGHELVTYRFTPDTRGAGQHAGYYVVDTVFTQAVLQVGTGGDRQTVTITRTGR